MLDYQHLNKWEQLNHSAAKKVEQFDAFYQIVRQVDDCFALIDWQSGHLLDVTATINHLQASAEQLQSWSGRIYKKLSSNLKNWAAALFSYQPVLCQALRPLQSQYGDMAISALARLWQIETDLTRRPLSRLQQQRRHGLWSDSFDQALALLCLAGNSFGPSGTNSVNSWGAPGGVVCWPNASIVCCVLS